MKEIKLTQGQAAIVDDEDYEYLNQWKWFARYNPHTHSFYAARSEYNPEVKVQRTLLMHRYIIGITNPQILCDHRNHNTLDNRKENLRMSNAAQNRANSRPCRNTTSKYLGVSLRKDIRKWQAQIRINSRVTHLGFFENEID